MITGGAGFIGRHLVRKIVQQKEYSKVIVIDNVRLENDGAFLEQVASSNQIIDLYTEDIRNKNAIDVILKKYEKIDTCIHLAAKTSVPASIFDPFETVDVNVRGTLSVLDACAKNNVDNFIFASSSAVYGETCSEPIREETILQPLSPYGASKIAGESLVTSYKNLAKIQNGICLRFFNVYGSGQCSDYAGVITNFSKRLDEGLPPIIYGDGGQFRDFISVDDIANALIISARSNLSGVFNIGTGVPTSINELAHEMIRIFGYDMQPVYLEPRSGDITYSCASITKARDVLKFVSTEGIRAGLMNLIRQQSIQQDLSRRSM